MLKAGAARFLILLLLVFFPILLAAQENGDDSEPSIESDWDDVYYTDLYVKGDQTFIISLGTVFPAVFLNNGELIDMNFTPPVGGVGALIYNYYFHSKFFVGGEISGMFIHSLRGNSLFIVPLGVRVGTQFLVWRLEFPVSISLGMSWHTYLDDGYYGFYMKAGAGAYFRATHEWSFGLSSNWAWFPQWTDDPKYNVDGNFVDVMLSARYHF